MIAPVLLATALLAGCRSDSAPRADARLKESDLLHHRFVLVSVDDGPVPQSLGQERAPDIEFGEKMHVSGSMCNRFFGQGELYDNVLTVKGLSATRMLCREPQLNQWDRLIDEVLRNGARLTLHDAELRLSAAGHQLVYARKDWVN